MNIGNRWDRMPLTKAEKAAALDVIVAAYEEGINLFDHADIYMCGKSEAAFAEVWREIPDLRNKIILQSKCGIRFQGAPQKSDPPRYDFSYHHIVHSVEGSLRRLKTDYLDILLLHRPDPLADPEEVAKAFDELHIGGKVRYFGVSNHTAAQITLLQKSVSQPLVINQVKLSMLHAYLIDEGIIANQDRDSTALTVGTLDYCRLNNIITQAWSPVAGGKLFNPPKNSEKRVKKAAAMVTRIAEEKRTSKEAIVLAWLLRHPAGIQPIIGTTKPERVKASCLADDVELTREEWYALFIAARGEPLP